MVGLAMSSVAAGSNDGAASVETGSSAVPHGEATTVADGSDSFEQHATQQVVPAVDEAVATAVPDEYRGSTSFGAAVILALAGRVEDEYTAAVTDDEVIELYGEHWDARGFLTRVESRFEAIRGDLDDEVRGEVDQELDVLRTELETAATPADVAGSVDALGVFLGETADGG